MRAFQLVAPLADLGVEARLLPWGERGSIQRKAEYVAAAMRIAAWADVVVAQKPPHPPWLIDTIAKINPALVVDFDDAVWANTDDHRNRLSGARVRGSRLAHAIRRARAVTVGSGVLARAVEERFSSKPVTILRSSVDMKAYGPPRTHVNRTPTVVGWIGSTENLEDFKPIIGMLQGLDRRMVLRIVSGHAIAPLPRAEFIPWSVERATQALHDFDIGIMPLSDSPRSRGRCGFKAIEYMSVGIPVVASDVGATREVVDDGITGYVVSGEDEWTDAIHKLAGNAAMRARIGSAGRRAVESRFSLEPYLDRFVAVLEGARGR